MMNRRSLLTIVWLLTLSSFAQAQEKAKSAHVPTPSEFLGFEVGADRKLADYRQIASYFKALAAASNRVELETLGKTTLGEDMFMAVISTEENLRNKAHYKDIAHKLADPRGLSTNRRSRPRWQNRPSPHLQHSLHRNRLQPNVHGVGLQPRHLARSRNPPSIKRFHRPPGPLA